MTPADLAKGFHEYLTNLNKGTSIGKWRFDGKTNEAYGTPGGSWKGKDGFLFSSQDNITCSYILRSIHNTNKNYLVIESNRLKGQLYNISLNNKRKHRNLNGESIILESFAMTIGHGAKKKDAVKKVFKELGENDDKIATLSDQKPNWDAFTNNLLDWAIVREEVKKKLKQSVSEPTSVREDEKRPSESSIPLSHNLILYGPPGTGKTYSTKAYAVSLAQQKDDKKDEYYLNEDNRTECTDVYKDLKSQGRIEFVTFHQSFSYEDFVQGIRPDVKVNQLAFKKVDGIFKRICTNALFEYYKVYWQNETKTKSKTFEELWSDFTAYVYREGKDPFEMNTISKLPVYATSISEYGNVIVSHANSSRSHTVSQERMKRLYEVFSKVSEIKNVVEDISGVIGGCNASAYWAVFSALKKFEKENHSAEQIRQEDLDSLSYEDRLKRVQNFSELKNYSQYNVSQYVLVIDEINRANISRVLGELITLLEPDKRFGQRDELIVTFPSGEPFTVPPNLHIIGTMNTADKSIAHLDVALRRRFRFEAMYPNEKKADEKHRHVMQKLNEAILERQSPDFTIGHSYFMSDAPIEDIMNERVIPLLNEYFPQRPEEVEQILIAAGLNVTRDAYKQLKCKVIENTPVAFNDEG